jgi:mutator protein MutT
MKRLRDLVGRDLLQMPCVAAVIRSDQGILMQKRKDDGRWALPGGAIDPGEAPAQALIREVHEEVGLTVRPIALLGVFGAFPEFRHVYPNGDEVHIIVSLFACEVTGGELTFRDGEATDACYFPVDEAARLTPKYASILRTREHDVQAYFVWREEWAHVFAPPVHE